MPSLVSWTQTRMFVKSPLESSYIDVLLGLLPVKMTIGIFFSSYAFLFWNDFPAGIYLLKVNSRNTRTRCKMCSKLTIKVEVRRQWRRSGIFIVNFEHISHLVLVLLLLILNIWLLVRLYLMIFWSFHSKVLHQSLISFLKIMTDRK